MKRRSVWRWLGRGLAGLGVVLAAWGITGMAMAAGGWSKPLRGEMVDVGGRSLRLVCEGVRQPGQPTVVFEAGAYSGAADWGVIQPQTAQFARACAYDRAGIGWSDPTNGPRDPGALADDLRTLLRAAGEEGPFVLVGHSMAGLMTRAFIAAYPDEVAGLVLVDAADPSAIEIPEARVWIQRFQQAARLGACLSRLGLMKPLTPFFANRIGLPAGSVALAEKRRMFGAPRHMKAAAAEITQTINGGARALDADPFLARIPVTTISAGPDRGRWSAAQKRAATLSSAGESLVVEDATHTSILGPRHAGVVVGAVRRVGGF
jgi:pimeloyl-ACP methyl ester carboxylesterase